jgi:hypothetical protein
VGGWIGEAWSPSNTSTSEEPNIPNYALTASGSVHSSCSMRAARCTCIGSTSLWRCVECIGGGEAAGCAMQARESEKCRGATSCTDGREINTVQPQKKKGAYQSAKYPTCTISSRCEYLITGTCTHLRHSTQYMRRRHGSMIVETSNQEKSGARSTRQ